MTGGQRLIEQGIEQGKRAMAASLLGQGVDAEVIARAAQLDVAEVEKIRATVDAVDGT